MVIKSLICIEFHDKRAKFVDFNLIANVELRSESMHHDHPIGSVLVSPKISPLGEVLLFYCFLFQFHKNIKYVDRLRSKMLMLKFLVLAPLQPS